MKVVIHAGAHETDEDRLLNCLISNRSLLTETGTVVPSPSSYRKLMRELLHAAEKNDVRPDARDIFLKEVVGSQTPDRLVLSNYWLFGTPKMSIAGGNLYKAAEWRLQVLHRVFQPDEIEWFMAIRNPATFLPAIVNTSTGNDILNRVNALDPATLRWSDLFQRIRNIIPDMPITVWCNEDTPLIWAELVREMAGLDPLAGFEGEFSLAEEIMVPAGVERFREFMAAHPDLTENQKRRVVVTFLDKFADQAAIEEEVDIPGWTEELIEHLSKLYDDDLVEIQKIPKVSVIAP